MSTKQIVLMIYGCYLIFLSLITFFMYLADKKKAEKGKWRIPEKVLLLSSFLGGAFGGYPAMILFRHKTKKLRFSIGFPTILITEIVIVIYYLYHFN